MGWKSFYPLTGWGSPRFKTALASERGAKCVFTVPAPAQTRAKCWLNTAEIQWEYETERDRTLPNITTHVHTHNTSHKDISHVGKIYLGGGANRTPMPRNYKLSLLNSQGRQEPLWSQQSWTRLLRGTTGKADHSTATLTWQGRSISLTFSSFFFLFFV